MQQEYAPGRHENSAGLVRCIRGKAIQMRRTFQQKGNGCRYPHIDQGRKRQTDRRESYIFSVPPAGYEQQQENRPERKSFAAHIRAQLSPVYTSSRRTGRPAGIIETLTIRSTAPVIIAAAAGYRPAA